MKITKTTSEMIMFLATQPQDAKWDLTEHKDVKPRTLDSNKYFWVLVNAIAKNQHLSDAEVHDKFLSENVCYYIKDDGAMDWKTAPDEPSKYGLLTEHSAKGSKYWKYAGYAVRLLKENGEPCKDSKGNVVTANVYWRIKGSHEMDTNEMSRLIESVVYEAKNLGIETATPAELEKMQSLWEREYGRTMGKNTKP